MKTFWWWIRLVVFTLLTTVGLIAACAGIIWLAFNGYGLVIVLAIIVIASVCIGILLAGVE